MGEQNDNRPCTANDAPIQIFGRFSLMPPLPFLALYLALLGAIPGSVVGSHLGGMYAMVTGALVGAVAPFLLLTPWVARHILLDRKTARILPGCAHRFDGRKHLITRLLRDFMETRHPDAPWDGTLTVLIKSTRTGTTVSYWTTSIAAFGKEEHLPDTLRAQIHALLFSDLPTLTPLQQRLWRRWVNANGYWSDTQSRYSAHALVGAHRRMATLSPAAFLVHPAAA